MKLKIHNPRILVVLLLMIGALATSAILLANQEDDEFPTKSLSIPTAPIANSISDQYQKEAINVVKDSGVVETINGDQEWKATRVLPTKLAGTEAVAVNVTWSNPVESTGPWSVLHCSNTLKAFTTAPWRQVKRLEVTVNMKTRSVVGLAVISEKEEDVPLPVMESLDADDKVKLLDVKTGDIVYEGPVSGAPRLEEVCAEGTYYRD